MTLVDDNLALGTHYSSIGLYNTEVGPDFSCDM